jgi:hypothetical protein
MLGIKTWSAAQRGNNNAIWTNLLRNNVQHEIRGMKQKGLIPLIAMGCDCPFTFCIKLFLIELYTCHLS